MYIAAKTLFIICQVELINKKKLAKTALDENFETFVVYIAALKAPGITIYLFWKAQVAFLQVNKAFTEIVFEHLDYANIFLANLAIELLEHKSINNHSIKLVKSKKFSYEMICSLGLVELKTLKTYIETYLKVEFIWPFNFSVGASILFDQQSNGSFYLYIDYQSLNNLTIK